ncbi:hypothetical protein [Gramella sp. AN32]|uniref:YhhN-like protein n=1 Tax=Christiangramia antarctica TaxID=2058158 RepID=A0ABW5X510_9FLAO|nr:hypothetical protein [Gramella sp. AN32]MCM4157844.1 hypothetical protein [Gramella sp. AN32]
MKNSLLVLGIFLVLLNFVLMYFFDESMSRFARFASTLIFFLIYTINIKPKTRPVLVFSLLLICDLALIFYEDPLFKTLAYISRIFAYGVLMRHVGSELKKIKFGKFQVITTTLVIAINLYMVAHLVEMVPEATEYLFFTILFYAYVLMIFILAIVALSYHSRYLNLKSFYYLCASLGLIFSDLLYYISYYLQFEFFSYADRFFNIIGMMCLVLFLSIKKGNEHTENQTFAFIK